MTHSQKSAPNDIKGGSAREKGLVLVARIFVVALYHLANWWGRRPARK